MLRLARAVLALALGGALVLAIVGAAVLQRAAAPGPTTAETTVVVEPGAGVGTIAATLTDAGVVDEPWLFRLYARLVGAERALTAGEYAFPAAVSTAEVVRMLRDHEVVEYRFTLVEGWTVAQTFRALGAADDLTGELPKPPPEGRLLPDTYLFQRGETRAELVRRMLEAMEVELAAAWAERAPDLPLDSADEALTLASIVEKETAVAAERELVAGVFVNRLARGMRLQTDPTVIYAVTAGVGPLDRPLLRRDLEVDDPYNTYVHPGLPPGPIANPGRASLRAAVNPAETDYLYFVADDSGGHAFARTLAEHNANVRAWRRHQRARDDG
ncbi:MAG: endolytic transglycosylase MltG [Alphaproteobacteria bacterium]